MICYWARSGAGKGKREIFRRPCDEETIDRPLAGAQPEGDKYPFFGLAAGSVKGNKRGPRHSVAFVPRKANLVWAPVRIYGRNDEGKEAPGPVLAWSLRENRLGFSLLSKGNLFPC